MIVKSMSDLIGRTPTLNITLRGGEVELFIKLEMFNPCGSMKDRMALSMLDALEREADTGVINVVESSSGNTASALAMLCSERGYGFRAVMDSHAARDKVSAVRAYGGEVLLVGDEGCGLMTSVRDEMAKDLAKAPRTYCTMQHDNPANATGYLGLAQEIVADIGDDITCLVSAVGTGGSLCGTAAALRPMLPGLHVIGVEPEGSILFGGPAHSYLQSGTGTPDGASVGLVVDYDLLHEGRKVSDRDAFAVCRVLARRYGLVVGGSAGGAIHEAVRYALGAAAGARVVTIACDTGAKYMNTIYDDDWLARAIPDIAEAVGTFDALLLGQSDYLAHRDRERARRCAVASAMPPNYFTI